MRTAHMFGFVRIPFYLLLLVLTGCPLVLGGVAAGAAGAYYFGELKATRNATLPQATAATEKAFAELGLPVVRREKDGLSGLIEGRGTEEKVITVRLKKIFDDVTDIRIRVGTLGDEGQSRIILERIENWLRSPVPTGVPARLP